MWKPNTQLYPSPIVSGSATVNVNTATDIEGQRRYELSNHLGNVLAVITDRKKGEGGVLNGNYLYFEAVTVTATDYFPFGMTMPGRSVAIDSYRYSFNGKEDDSEWAKQDYGFRIYDKRIGRFLSLDPLSAKYPMLTPYQFASNTPIRATDLDGLEAYLFINDKQRFAVLQFQSGEHLNVTWMCVKMTTFDDVASHLEHENKMSGTKAKVVYITMHGEPGQIFTDPGPNGVIETEPCQMGPNGIDCPPNDDKSFWGPSTVDGYIKYREKNPTGFDPSAEFMPRIEKLKKVMDQIQDGGTLILGGCSIGDGADGDDMLKAMSRLCKNRINIVANQDFTNETRVKEDKVMFLDSGRTTNKRFEGGWKIIGPAAQAKAGEVESTGKNLQLNSQNSDKCYEFTEEKK